MDYKKRKLTMGFCITILLATTLACGSTTATLAPTDTAEPISTQVPSPTFTPIPVNTVITLVSRSTDESSDSPAYTIKAQTPFYEGSEDQRVINFNNEMQLLTQEEIGNFKDNAAQTKPVAGLAGSSYNQEYQVLSGPGNLVSIKFQITIYIQGAAHPGTHTRTVTYDLESGSDISLTQLFLPNSDFLQQISDYCVAQLKTRSIGFEDFSSGADPIPANYGNWNLTPDGLLITFDEYQVAPYAAGPQEVTIPYSQLHTILDPQGPLGQYAGQ
jgi:hypothetical protein